MDPVAAFWAQCAEAAAALDAPGSTGLPALERPAHALVELATSQPGARTRLAPCFLQLARDEGGPWELLAPCMFVLRWAEVEAGLREQLGAALASNDWRAIPVLHHLLEAFSDGWSDADLFPRLASLRVSPA